MGWQKIETAPKDGTRILVYGGTYYSDGGGSAMSYDDYPLVEVREARWYRDDWCLGFGNGYDVELWGKPTHWMPLPPPPSQEK